MRASTFFMAGGLALCLCLAAAPAGAQTDASGFIRLTPEQTSGKTFPAATGCRWPSYPATPAKRVFTSFASSFRPGS